MHLNEAANGVYVPHLRDAIDTYETSIGTRHGRLQGQAYLQKVWDRLNSIQQPNAEKLRDELQKIAYEISENRFI